MSGLPDFSLFLTQDSLLHGFAKVLQYCVFSLKDVRHSSLPQVYTIVRQLHTATFILYRQAKAE